MESWEGKTAEEQYQKYGVEILRFFNDTNLWKLMDERMSTEASPGDYQLMLDNPLLIWIFQSASEPLQQRLLSHLNSVRRPLFEQALADYERGQLQHEIDADACEKRLIEVLDANLEWGSLHWGGAMTTTRQQEITAEKVSEGVAAFVKVHQEREDIDLLGLIEAWYDLAHLRRRVSPESPLLEQLLKVSNDEVLKGQIRLQMSGASLSALRARIRSDIAHELMKFRQRLALIRYSVEQMVWDISPEAFEHDLCDRFSVEGELPSPADPPVITERMELDQLLVNMVASKRLVQEDGSWLVLETLLNDEADAYVAMGFQGLVDGKSTDLVLRMMRMGIPAIVTGDSGGS